MASDGVFGSFFSAHPCTTKLERREKKAHYNHQNTNEHCMIKLLTVIIISI